MSYELPCGNTYTNIEKKLMENDKAYYDLVECYKELEKEKEALVKCIKGKECEVMNLNKQLGTLFSTVNNQDCQLEEKEKKLRKAMKELGVREEECDMLKKKLGCHEHCYYHHCHQQESVGVGVGVGRNNSDEVENMIKRLEENIRSLSIEKQKVINGNMEKDKAIEQLIKHNELLKKKNHELRVINSRFSNGQEVENNNSNNNNNSNTNSNNNTKSHTNIFHSHSNGDLLNKAGFPYNSSRGNNNNTNTNTFNQCVLNENILHKLHANHQSQLQQKETIYNELHSNYKQVLEENEHLVQFTIDQIKSIEQCLDLDYVPHNNINNNLDNDQDCATDRTTRLKYDLITKTIDFIIKKIMEKLGSDYLLLEQNRHEIEACHNKNKELTLINDKLSSSNTHFEQYSSMLTQEMKSKSQSVKEIDLKYNELYTRCKHIEEILDASNEKYTTLEGDCNAFCNECLKMIHEFLISIDPSVEILHSDNDIKSKQDKILESILFFGRSITKTMKDVERAKNTMSFIRRQPKVDNDITNDQSLSYCSNDLINTLQGKYDDCRSHSNVLQQKNHELASLLEESYHTIGLLKEELKEMNHRNSQLEHEYQIQSQSHEEIETIIGSNALLSKEVINEKEKKNMSLMQEIELKNIQIKALEKFVRELQKNVKEPCLEQMKGRIVSKEQLINVLRKRDSCTVQDDQRERDLRLFLQQFQTDSNCCPTVENIQVGAQDINESLNVSSNASNDNDQAFNNMSSVGRIYYNNLRKMPRDPQ